MQFRFSGFLIVIFLSASLLSWGQIIQSAPPDSSPAQPAPQTAPQPVLGKNGGDFSSVTNPDPKGVVPKDMILVKGAWSSASDSTTPVPEGATLANNIFTDRYFGISYPLPPDWIQKYTPPPPSGTGGYVLSQISRTDSYKGEARGSILFTAPENKAVLS